MVNFRPQPTREFVQQYVSQIYSKIKKSLDHILQSFWVQNRIRGWTRLKYANDSKLGKVSGKFRFSRFYYSSSAQFHGVDHPIGGCA